MKKEQTKDVFFCSTASRYFKESLAGTAANYKGFILLEHGDPFPEKTIDAHFDKDWLRGVHQLAKIKGFKVLLVRNKHSGFDACTITYVDFLRQAYFQINTCRKDIAGITIGSFIDAPETVWRKELFYVVCTNGKKDKCCAKFGFPVYKFFENNCTGLNVWECTHLGGDRFAANVVCLPLGIYYGRVMVEDVDTIIEKTRQGFIHENNYRGLSRYSFPVQAVECAMRGHLNNYRFDFPSTIVQESQDGDTYSFMVDVAGYGRFSVTMLRQRINYPYLLTCKAAHPEPVVKYEVLRIENVEM